MYKRYTTWLKILSISMLLMTASLLAHSNLNESASESGRTIYSICCGGDWNNTTTWVGGIIPGLRDKAVLVENAQVNVTHDVWVYQIQLNYSATLYIGNNSRDVNLTFDDKSGAGLVLKKGLHKYLNFICAGSKENPVNISCGPNNYWFLYNLTSSGVGPPSLDIHATNTTWWRYRWGCMDTKNDMFFDNCTLKCSYGQCIRQTYDKYSQDEVPFFKNCKMMAGSCIYSSGVFEHCVIDIPGGLIAESADEIMVFYKCLFPSSHPISRLYGKYYPYDIVGGNGMIFYDYKNTEINNDGDYVCIGGHHRWQPQHGTALYFNRIPQKYLPRYTDRILVSGSANPYFFEIRFDINYTFYKITTNGHKHPPHIFFGNASQKLNFTFKDLEGSGIFTTTHVNNMGQFINISNCSFSKETNANYTIFNLENALDLDIRNVTIDSIGEVRIGQPDKESGGKVLYGSRIALVNLRISNSTYGLIFGYKIGNTTNLSFSNIEIENSEKYGVNIKTKSRKITIENISIKGSGIADIKMGNNSILELRNSTFSTIDKINTNWTIFSLNHNRTDTNITWLNKTPINNKITFISNYTGQYNVLKPVGWDNWSVYDETDGVNLTKESILLDGYIQFNATAGKLYMIQKADDKTPDPCIHIEKHTNGEDADDPTGPYIPVGETVTWTYIVTNCGNVELSAIQVTDNIGVTPTYVSGDTNGDGILDLDETWTYEATGTAVAGQYSNIGTATGTPPVGDDVSDDDPSHYYGNQSQQTNPNLYSWLFNIREEWNFLKREFRRYIPI